MRGNIGRTTGPPVGGRVVSRGTMVTTGGRLLAAAAVGMMRLLLAVVMITRVVVLVPAVAHACVIVVTGEGRKCSWFKVELRRLGGADGILLLRIANTGAAGAAAAAG